MAELSAGHSAGEPIIRRKCLSAFNDAGMLTVIDAGEHGSFATDEPVAHGGTGEGSLPAPNSARGSLRLRVCDVQPDGR
jgi:hypothetical protein